VLAHKARHQAGLGLAIRVIDTRFHEQACRNPFAHGEAKARMPLIPPDQGGCGRPNAVGCRSADHASAITS
jgi:hypothetical protein